MQPLSDQLSNLAAHAKRAEDAAAAARQEAHNELVARRAQTRAAVEAAVQQADKQLSSLGDSTAQHWSTLKAWGAIENQSGLACQKQSTSVEATGGSVT
jgi:hypothetical protein